MDVHDRRDAEALLKVLRDEVIPLYYDRDVDGLPRAWISRMKRAIRTLGIASRPVAWWPTTSPVVHPGGRRHQLRHETGLAACGRLEAWGIMNRCALDAATFRHGHAASTRR